MRPEKQKPDSSGINIAPPRLETKKIAGADAALDFIIILMCVFGAAWCGVSAFSLPVLPATLTLYSLLFACVLTLTFYLKRASSLVLIVITLLYTAALWYLRKAFVLGFIIATNQIMTTYASHSEYVLPIYEVAAKPSQYRELCTVFLVFAVFLISCLVSWAVIRRKSFWVTFWVTAPFLAASLIFYITPDFSSVLLLLAGWISLLFMRLSIGNRKCFLKIRNISLLKNSRAAVRSGFLMLPTIFLCFALILAAFPRQSYQRSPNADRMKESFTDAVTQTLLSGGDGSLAGTVNRVNLSNADEIHFSGKTMLKINSDKQYPLYLKGFSGSVYTGTSWEQLPDSDYTEINQKLNGLAVQNMFSKMMPLAGELDDSKYNPFGIRVQNVAASKQSIYAPYNLSTTPQNITGVHFVNDVFIRSNSLFGTSEYSLYGYSIPEGTYSNPSGIYFAIAYNSIDGRNLDFKELSGSEKNYLLRQSETDRLNFNNIKAFYTSILPNKLMNALQGEKKKFMQSEQDYRLFAYDKYTQLPPAAKKMALNLLKKDIMLKGFFDEDSLSLSSQSLSSVNSIADAVKSYLSRGYYYTLSPGRVPKGKEFTEYFLLENRKGYCVHFATAATVMLRAMGVPARYAEGYVVTQEDYKTAEKDGWANIRDSRAHAWVEIYQPGLGWQPIEVTPGFNVEENLTQDNNPVNQPPVSSEPENSAPKQSEPESLASSKASQPSLPGAVSSEAVPPGGTGGNKDLSAAMLPAAVTIAAVVLLLAAAALRRKLQLISRAKSFRLKNTNQSVLNVYAYITRLTRFGAEIPEEIEYISLKARFSKHIITEEELVKVVSSAEALAQQTYHRLPTARRILLKYIHNLI
jgi:transglutaminase-like putative cysteine protease